MLAVQRGALATERNGALLPFAKEQRCAGALGLFRFQRRQFLRRLGLLGCGGQQAQFLRDGAERDGAGIRPFQLGFRRCADGSGAGLEKIAGDQQLVGVEQPLDTFVVGVERGKQFPALVGVAQ